MNIVDSPSCKCGELIQSINHIFWTCPILESDRFKMCRIFGLNMFDSFLIEYLLGNLNKKVAAIVKFIKMLIVKFIKIVSIKC